MKKRRICIIYTGGTIGMIPSERGYIPSSGAFRRLLRAIPDLYWDAMPEWDVVEFDPLLDSSDVAVREWNQMGRAIAERYDDYDGFVILHGTDTMAYSASALAFMLENLAKPVIFTGAQIPLGQIRTDGRDNIINSMLIAASGRVHEVCIYFNSRLLRGNRSVKVNATGFDAFGSPNYPPLATAGISIKYNSSYIHYPQNGHKSFAIHTSLDTRVSILKIHPGITEQAVRDILLGSGTRAVILETYGAGNAISKDWFLRIVREADRMGKVLLNVTQCLSGDVDMDIYATGRNLKDAGVISGHDTTTESALGKLFYLMGNYDDNAKVKALLEKNLKGEISK